MNTISTPTFATSTIKLEFRKAIREQSERGLLNSAKWVGEQLIHLPKSSNSTPTTTSPQILTAEDYDLMDAISFAKSLFDVKEYLRCSHVLQTATFSKHKKFNTSLLQKGLFLRLYSLYLAGEKRKEEEVHELSGAALDQVSMVSATIENKHLRAIYEELCQSMSIFDGYLWYLYAVVLRHHIPTETKKRVEALMNSVTKEPCLWCAWTELLQEKSKIILPASTNPTFQYVQQLWEASYDLEEQEPEKSLDIYNSIKNTYYSGKSCGSYIDCQIAIGYYQLTQYEDAQQIFEQLCEQDPFRLEHWDTYSNILYVKRQKTKLSSLAQKSIEYDKYRPETCCVIGNYYSLRGDHVRAIQYFQRALKLDKKYLSAWTLMGHEYVELKNTTAAVHAYRTAVDINPKDYRAWYGLGQTYEIVRMQLYALFYYSKATSLKPYDGRMWCALAGCYSQLERYEEAIKCYKRALQYNHHHDVSTAIIKLAELYKKLNQKDLAAQYYIKLLGTLRNQGEEEQAATESELNTSTSSSTGTVQRTTSFVTEETLEIEANALFYLAKYYKDEKGDLAKSSVICMQIVEHRRPGAAPALRSFNYPEPIVEQARSLLQEIRNTKTSQ